MVNSSSQQQSTLTPASQARRSTRLSLRNSIVGTPSRPLRQPSIRRSSRNNPSLVEEFDWGESFGIVPHDTAKQSRNGNELPWDDFEEFLNPNYASEQAPNGASGGKYSFNYYDNPGVAVPGTPRNMSFPPANQQMGTPMGNQLGTVPLTPVVINGQTIMLRQDQVNAMNAVVSEAGPQALLTDGKRTSVPKSPGLRQHRHNQLRGQASYNDPFVGAEHVDPSLLGSNDYNGYSMYPEPNAHHGGFSEIYQPQPYYRSTHWQGVPSPSGRHPRTQPIEPVYVQPIPQQKVGEPVQGFGFPNLHANKYQASSNSTYASRKNFSRNGRRNSPVNQKKMNRQDLARALAEKRISVFNRDAIHQYQKPKVAAFNPEVRINKTTKGLTTRTAKINQYDPRKFYTYSAHPLGTPGEPHGAPWKHPNGRYKHKYRDSSLKEYEGGDEVAIYELEDRAMTADKVKDFILNYPSDRNTLTLRIQIQPGDSGRRYRQGADKCRFAECPLREGGLPATIKHGWYRVAFDERNDDNYDPFAASCGFAHLYCMERFLDFEYICRKANVVVDFRSHMRGEPKGTFAAAFQGKQVDAGQLADTFIHLACTKPDDYVPRQRGNKLGVRQMAEFANYPVHQPYSGEVWDPSYAFESTLSYHMMLIMEVHRPAAQMTQFAGKGLGPTQLSVNRGDLGMHAEADIREKQLRKMNKAKGKKMGKNVAEAYAFGGNSSFDREVRRRVERAELVLQQKALFKRTKLATFEQVEDDPGQNMAFNPASKEPWDVDEDESDVEDAGRPFRTGTRRSKRNVGKQPNYHDEADASLAYDRPLKRSYQQYKQSQHTTDQQSHGQAQQHLRNSYMQAGNAQDFVEERAPKRTSSAMPPPGYARALSYRPDATSKQWEMDEYVDYHGDLGHLGLDTSLAPSPRSPGRKRRRPSHGDELQQPGRSPTRRLSSIMRHSGLRTPSATKRHASFHTPPVTQQKMFHSEAPSYNVQPRMLKELEGDASSQHGSNKGDPAGRTLRSGRSLGGSVSE